MADVSPLRESLSSGDGVLWLLGSLGCLLVAGLSVSSGEYLIAAGRLLLALGGVYRGSRSA